MDENMNFDNFNDIWQRVNRSDEDDMLPISEEPEKTEPAFIVKQCPRSRCIRFLPSF